MKEKSTFLQSSFKKGGLLLLFLLISVTFAFSQVKGKVTDQSNEGMPGVSVSIKGTNKGTQTNGNGDYNLEASKNAILVFSFVGYSTKEVVFTGQSEVNVTLDLDDKILSEVVVVGYGSQLKKSVTGSVQTIGAKEIKDIPVSQIGQKLQGQLAGVQINQTTGKPGQGMNIRIRGQLSVSAGSDPLYVVDGFPITGNIGAINPDEIEEITVLKDASSTSMYGSRAANGVVLITTKRGKSGTNVSFSAFAGTQEVPVKGRISMLNAEEFAQFKKESYEDAKQPVPLEFQNPADYRDKNNDWYGALLRTRAIREGSVARVRWRRSAARPDGSAAAASARRIRADGSGHRTRRLRDRARRRCRGSSHVGCALSDPRKVDRPWLRSGRSLGRRPAALDPDPEQGRVGARGRASLPPLILH